jgi:hypothetical protein
LEHLVLELIAKILMIRREFSYQHGRRSPKVK